MSFMEFLLSIHSVIGLQRLSGKRRYGRLLLFEVSSCLPLAVRDALDVLHRLREIFVLIRFLYVAIDRANSAQNGSGEGDFIGTTGFVIFRFLQLAACAVAIYVHSRLVM